MSGLMRSDDIVHIVPFAVKPIRLKIDALHFFLADFAAGWIFAAVQSAGHFQPSTIRGAGPASSGRSDPPPSIPPPEPVPFRSQGPSSGHCAAKGSSSEAGSEGPCPRFRRCGVFFGSLFLCCRTVPNLKGPRGR